MKQRSARELRLNGNIGVDTTLVLFFMALEYGRAVAAVSLDGLLMGITMLMILVLPYFLPSHDQKSSIQVWLFRRGVIALAGLLMGFIIKQSIGTVLPEAIRFIPMTLLILASMVSCYI